MNRLKFGILAGTMLLSMIGFGLIVPLLPVYAREFGASSVEVGLLFSVTALANLILLPVIGPLSDRYGRVLFLCLGLLLMALATLGFYVSHSVEAILVCRFTQGVAMSMHLPVAQAMLGDMIPAGQEGRWMGYFSAVLFAGLGAGPLLGGVASDMFGVQQVFILSAAAMIAALIATAIFLRDDMHRTVTDPKTSGWSWQLLANPFVCGVAALQICNGALTGLSMAFLPVLGAEQLALGASAIGLVLFIRSPVSMLQSWSGKLADTHNRKLLISVGVVLSSIAIATMPNTTGLWTLLLANTLLSLGMVLLQPAASAYMVEQGRTIGMGFAMSLGFMAMQIGGGFGPVGAGWIMQDAGLEAGFYAAAVVNLLGLLVFLFLMRHQHHGAQKTAASI